MSTTTSRRGVSGRPLEWARRVTFVGQEEPVLRKFYEIPADVLISPLCDPHQDKKEGVWVIFAFFKRASYWLNLRT